MKATRSQVESWVRGELVHCLGIITEVRRHKPNAQTVDHVVENIVQRLIHEGLTIDEDEQ